MIKINNSELPCLTFQYIIISTCMYITQSSVNSTSQHVVNIHTSLCNVKVMLRVHAVNQSAGYIALHVQFKCTNMPHTPVTSVNKYNSSLLVMQCVVVSAPAHPPPFTHNKLINMHFAKLCVVPDSTSTSWHTSPRQVTRPVQQHTRTCITTLLMLSTQCMLPHHLHFTQYKLATST